MPKKEFKPSFPNLPRLLTYRGVLPEPYWSHWEKKSYDELKPFKSWICPEKLEIMALKLGYTGKEE